MYSLCCRFLFEGNNRQENANSEQEHRSSGRQHDQNMGFKTEKQSELVRSIIHIISIIFIKHIMPIKYTCMCEFVGVLFFLKPFLQI